MKKKKILDRVKYEVNPWGDDEPIIGKRVKDFLPSPEALKNAKVRIIHQKNELSLEIKDHQKLKQRAAKIGISEEALMSAILSDYARGKLVPADK